MFKTKRQPTVANLVEAMNDKCKFISESDEHKSNNNEEDFESGYTLNRTKMNSGRASSGSRESAFSSGSDSEEGSLVSSTSDRDSPADLCAFKKGKILNPCSNIVPEAKQAIELIDTVRVRFLNSLDEENRELYDSSDIAEVSKALPANSLEQSTTFRWISRYLNFQNSLAIDNNRSPGQAIKDVDEAVESLKELLKFRKHYELSQALPDQFCKEFYILSGILPFGVDRQNLPVLYLRARVHRRWSHKLDDTFRRYVAWQLDQMTKSYRGAKVAKTIGCNAIEKDGSFGICFDCLHVSYSCLDMDFLRYLVRLLVQFYPTYCRYALCVDLPWIFRSVWKLVRSWLPEDAQNTVQFITSTQLTEFISEDQIPNSMKINDLKASDKSARGKHQFPKNWDSFKGVEEYAEELGCSPNELKQFRNHLEKVRKEYETLGAL